MGAGIMWSAHHTYIDVLRLRGASDNTPALRLAVASLLSTAELRPMGVSPAAILIVRKMADPLPGRLAPHRRAIRIDTAWENAFQRALVAIYRHATRPAQGRIPTSANAVLFADEGEMLACLALDISRGVAWEHWWWKALLRTLPSSAADGLTFLLCSKARYVPAVLNHLAEWRQALAVLHTVSPEQAMTVLSAMTRAYSMADFHADSDAAREPLPPEKQNLATSRTVTPTSAASKSRSGDPIHQRPYIASVAPVKAPWERWLPARHLLQRLGKERASLLGVGIALYREPALVRNSDFLHTLHSWWEEPHAPLVTKEDSPGNSAPQPARKHPDWRRDQHLFAANRQVDASEDFGHRRRTMPRISRAAQDVTGKSLVSARNRQVSKEFQQEISAESLNPILSCTQSVKGEFWGDGERREEELRTRDGTAAEDTSALGFAEGVSTELGGVLYLINLMRYLDLPACFEEGWRLASQVGTWGTLEVLGRALLGQDAAPLADDPLWQALAALDGRELGELPGETSGGSDCFRLPTRWVNEVRGGEGTAYYWAVNQQRMYLWCEPGYVLVDCPRNTSTPEAQARDELRAYAVEPGGLSVYSRPLDQVPSDNLTSPLVQELHLHLARWLASVLPYIRCRLHHALYRTEAATPDLETMLLRYRGRLYVTSTHVDLVMRLDDISLPVRLAGLDCNPGWLPDFARVVQFHFT
jgi:hypothetical protein